MRGNTMKLMKALFLTYLIYGATIVGADENPKVIKHLQKMDVATAVLTEAGNDIFGTIQEVILKLNNDPNTDWSKVNVEALRQHLLDMHDMVINVDVISLKAIPNGLKCIIKPTTNRAISALKRVLQSHPAQLKHETGWSMKISVDNDKYILTTTSQDPKDVQKIIGLSYIGLMASGSHHQTHHFDIAAGRNPHAHHFKIKY
jgi:hypothetical protein